MRENRLHGSEGGEGVSPFRPLSTATIRGTVTDAATGQVLSGVSIVAGAQTTVTAADGSFQLNQVPPGSVTVSAELAGYQSISGQAQLQAGEVLLFSPKLVPGTDSNYLFGTIQDAATGQPLAGVMVNISGATTASATTDAAGAYRIEPLVAGSSSIIASLPGYDTVSAQLTVFEGTNYAFSPQLYALGTTTPGANTASVSGIVMDSTTNQPLSGVTLKATYGTTIETLSTDTQGRFDVSGITESDITLDFSLANYQAVQLMLPVAPLSAADIGQIRMRPKAVEVLLPDLVVETLAKQNAITDPQSLAITGTLQASVKNQGTAITGTLAEVLAYYDTDRDGQYNADMDTALGSAYLSGPLVVGDTEIITIPLSGTVPFRDAPLKVWVDSLQTVVESNEANNQAVTSDACQGEPLPVGKLDPVVKWEWKGSAYQSSYNQVMMAPVVAQLNDDNGDGLIDQEDIPDVIFSAFSGSNYFTALLRAVSGKDGTEIWQKPNWVSGLFSPAVGDIDHDGLIEIVIGGAYNNGLLVFENDGTPKWSVSVTSDASEVYGGAHPLLADLNHDGEVEIIYGRHVFHISESGNEELYWSGAVGEMAPAIADLDMDGTLDIVMGSRAYHYDGSLLWDSTSNPMLSGLWGTSDTVFSAVANFDDDPYPEIAVKGGSILYLLEHSGEVKWGVSISGGGGGPLTIADFDGDGQPEIGTAGKSYYVVFETDGSEKWKKSTQDYSSYTTGSSVFDFEGDGKAEVLYADELKFRIYNGADGAEKYSIANSSGTAWEYPVVADIDNDDHAEVIVISNNYYISGTNGIRVFENRNDDWMPTRSIWNEHAYHIDNVNDDGTIPQFEAKSWQTHNTYRLNTFPNRSVLQQADLSVSRLMLIDHGFGQWPSVNVRLGNGGLVTPKPSITVAFYQGDPNSGGILLGTVNAGSLAAGQYRDITLDNVHLSNTSDLYAVVDPNNTISECDEGNNRLAIPLQDAVVSGLLQVSVDAPAYGPNAPVSLGAHVHNTGALLASYQVALRIEDASGDVVVEFPQHWVTDLIGGTSSSLAEIWNTNTYLTGSYRLRGYLYDAGGRLLDETSAPFQIVAGPAVQIDGQVTADRPAYAAWDSVNLVARVENITANAIQPPTHVEIQVTAPGGQVLLSQSADLGELLPGNLRDLAYNLNLADAVSGDYLVTLTVQDAATQTPLITRATSFSVNRQTMQALTGQIEAAPLQVYQGTPVTCLEQVQNRSATPLPGVQLISQLVHAYDGQVLRSTPRSIDFAANEQRSDPQTVETGYLAAGTYACVLLAELNGQTQTLGAALFDVWRALPGGQITTDKAVYAAWDSVNIAAQVENIVANAIQSPTHVEIQVTAPDGQVLLNESAELNELLPGALRDLNFNLNLADVAGGNYTVTMTVQDAATHSLLITRSTTFSVEWQPIQALLGQVAAAPVQVPQGDPLTCSEQVQNRSARPVPGVQLTSQLVRTKDGQVLNATTRSVDFAGNGQSSASRPIATGDLAVGTYACVLLAELNGQRQALGAALFDVKPPPIRIDAGLQAGDRGRVLVLVDSKPDKCLGVSKLNLETGLTAPLTAAARVDVKLVNAQGILIDSESAALDTRNVNRNGLKQSIGLSIDDFSSRHLALQIDAPKGITTSLNISAEITDAGVSLAKSSGTLNAVCPAQVTVDNLFGDYRLASVQRLSAADDPLALVHNPSLDVQKQHLQTLLSQAGWSYTIVADEAAFTQALHSGSYVAYLLLSAQVKLDEPVQKELREAVYRGEGLIEAGAHDQRQGRIDEALGIKYLGKLTGIAGVTVPDSEVYPAGSAVFLTGGKPLKADSLGTATLGLYSDTTLIAMTDWAYGLGRADYFGFDLIAEAAMPGADPLFDQLLLGALAHVHPGSLAPIAGGVYPLRLTLANQGIAVPGQSVLSLPAGVGVIDGGLGTLSSSSLTWPFNLEVGATQTFDAWIRLPATPVTLSALIQTGTSPNFNDYATKTLSLTPEAAALTLDSLVSDTQSLDANVYKQVLKYLQWAQQDQANGNYASAWASLIRASDALIDIGPSADATLRLHIAQAIRAAAQKL